MRSSTAPTAGARGVAGFLERIVVGARGDRRRLGRPVGPLDPAVEGARRVLHEGRRHRGAATRDQADGGHVGAGSFGQRAGHGDEEGRRARQEGDALRATSASACSGSKRRTRTERRPAAPGTRTPLSSPEMWAIGAGISTASAGPRPWTRAINEAFQLSPRCVWSTALGIPVEPEVNRTRATSAGRLGRAPAGTGAPPTASARAAGSEKASVPISSTRAGSIWSRAALTSARAERCRRARHGPDAPAGPGQDGGRQTVGDLPRHGLAPPHPRSRSPPATVATSASATSPGAGWCRPPPRRRGR